MDFTGVRLLLDEGGVVQDRKYFVRRPVYPVQKNGVSNFSASIMPLLNFFYIFRSGEKNVWRNLSTEAASSDRGYPT